MEALKIRIDKYLWAIRLFKTRSQAADACDNGKIKMNGVSVKPSKNVQIGDEYEVKTENKKWRIKVTGMLDHRVQYKDAIQYYSDITPPEELTRIAYTASAFYTGKRLSKTGRPTKKNKRDLDAFLGN